MPDYVMFLKDFDDKPFKWMAVIVEKDHPVRKHHVIDVETFQTREEAEEWWPKYLAKKQAN